MRKLTSFALLTAFAVAASCSSSTGSAPAGAAASAPTPAAAQAPGAAPAGARGGGGAGGVGGAPAPQGAGRGGRGGGQGPALTLEQRQARADSIAAVRAETVKELMATISGKENQPAGQVFKNVQLMKNVPAGEFLTAMDKGIGRGTGHGCNDCHVVNDWASDSLGRKKTARTMMGIVSDINTSLLPRLGPGRGGQPRAIQCLTCHRGGPAGRNVIIP